MKKNFTQGGTIMQSGLDFPSSDFVVVGLAALTALIGILFIPLMLGIRLLRKAGQGELHRMAGLLTLMPVLTEPLFWLFPALLLWLYPDGAPLSGAAGGRLLGVILICVLAVLPSVVLTCLIALRCRRCFSGSIAPTAWFLLIFACVRWLNSFMIFAAPAVEIDSDVFPIIGLALPTVFAIAASYASSRATKVMEA